MQSRWVRLLVNAGVAGAVFLVAFGFYFLTGASDLAWMEGAEYQRRVEVSDVGEGPWERPLFVLLSQPFLLLPGEALARRANWAAAAFSAGACLFVYLLMRVLLQMAPQFIARRVGILAAISLGISHTFWMRAVAPGPEPLDALLLAAMLFFLVRFTNDGGAKNLYLAMALLGLSLANNLLMIFLVPLVAIFVRVVQPPLIRNIGAVRLRGALVLLVAALPAALLALNHWWQGGFEIPEEHLRWMTFWESRMRLTWEQPLQESLTRFGAMLLLNFPPWTAFIGLIGLWELFRRQKHVFGLIFPLFLVYAFLVVTLELPTPVPAYLPAWVFFSVAVGYGWWKLLSSGSWQGFAVALILSAAPLLIYRFAPLALEQLQMDLRAEALLDVPKELPVDHLAFELNPDRRDLPDARSFASAALSALPEGATVFSGSRMSELMTAPVRYLADVEKVKAVSFVDFQAVAELTRNPDRPLFTMGLHPPNDGVGLLLVTHHFQAVGDWFRLLPLTETGGRVLADVPGSEEDVLDDAALIGSWYGAALPQGYPLTLEIAGAPGNLSGTATLNADGARPLVGRFDRLSSTVGAVLGSVDHGEHEVVHIHIDATHSGNRLEGSWTVYEIEALSGSFVVWKQPEAVRQE